MPWPGPHVTLWTYMLVLLGPTEMQSSPTAIIEEVMLILAELPMWMPSVFGPFGGDVMMRPLTLMSRLPEKLMWKPLSLNMEKLHIFPFETSSNFSDCSIHMTQKYNVFISQANGFRVNGIVCNARYLDLKRLTVCFKYYSISNQTIFNFEKVKNISPHQIGLECHYAS